MTLGGVFPAQEPASFGPQVQADGWAIAAFVAYLIVLVGIGAWSSRFSSRGIGEFFVGGRRMNRLVVALSAVASGRSVWLLTGVTGLAFVRGASALWAVVGYTAVEALLFLFYAPRLRRFAGAHDCITIPDFLAARFDDRRGTLRLAAGLVILVFMVMYVAAQFVGGGKAMAASFGLAPAQGVLLTAVIVLAYTLLGGFLAASLTDTIQAILMLGVLLVVPLVAVAGAGGPAAAWQGLVALQPAGSGGFLDPLAIGAGALIGFVGIGLGSPGNPHILVRYISIEDPAQLRWVAVVGTAWNALMAAGAIVVGLLGRLYFATVDAVPLADAENLFPALSSQLLPPVAFGVVVAAIFAAIMSSADSQLLVAASTLVRDIYQKIMGGGRELTPRQLVGISRAVVTALVAVALVLGWSAEGLVLWLVLVAWAGLGAALGPTTVLALFWRRTTHAGVLAGLLTGALTTIVWYNTPALKSHLYELIPAFALSLLATWIVSLLTEPPGDAGDAMAVMTGERRS